MTKLRVGITVVALLALVAGCAATKSDTTSSSNLVIDVTISNGSVNPTNAELTAKVRTPIQIRVTSDAPDELHVHSVPDHTFEVKAEPNQTFQFTVDVPGTVEVELHKLDRTVATIQVRQ